METLAIDGGKPVRKEPFPSWPIYGQEEERLVMEVVRSGKWGGTGEVKSPEFQAKLPQFIDEFSSFQGAKHGVPVVNGTMAITVALRACGVEPGDEVIMPSYTFIATATSALIFGAVPVFVDVEADTLLLDPEKVEAAITPKTKAIIAVHIAGAVADMTRLKEISEKHNLKLIEDAAQAVGAQWEEKGAGILGDIGTFSFQSSKNITAGEGGMILSNDTELIDRAWSFANVGRVRDGAWYQHEEIGWNLRMTEFQAAILLAQMTRLEEHLAIRERNANLLNKLLGDIRGIRLLKRDERITRHAHHIFMFKIDDFLADRFDKNEILGKISAEGIPVSAGYVPLDKNKAVLKDIKSLTGKSPAFSCPITEKMADKQVLWLPQNVMLADEKSMYDIASAVKKVLSALV